MSSKETLDKIFQQVQKEIKADLLRRVSDVLGRKKGCESCGTELIFEKIDATTIYYHCEKCHTVYTWSW